MLARAVPWHDRDVRLLAVVLVAITLLAGCGGDDGDDVRAAAAASDSAPAPPERGADITGPVATVRPAVPAGGEPCTTGGDESTSSDGDAACDPTQGTGRPGSVRIDEGTGTYTAAVARVDDDTSVLRRGSDGFEQATFDDVRAGDRVEIWFEGPVAESHPVQGRAATVLLGD